MVDSRLVSIPILVAWRIQVSTNGWALP